MSYDSSNWYWIKWSPVTPTGADLHIIESVPVDRSGNRLSPEGLVEYCGKLTPTELRRQSNGNDCPYFLVPKRHILGDWAGQAYAKLGLWIFSERLYNSMAEAEFNLLEYYFWNPIIVFKGAKFPSLSQPEIFYMARSPNNGRFIHYCVDNFDKDSVFNFVFQTNADRSILSSGWRLIDPPDVELFQARCTDRSHPYSVLVCSGRFRDLVLENGYVGFAFYPHSTEAGKGKPEKGTVPINHSPTV